MAAPPAPGPPRSPPALWPALAQYGAALTLILAGTSVLLAAVGLWRTHGHPADLSAEVTAFAQSRWGLVGASLVSAVSLSIVAATSARLERRPLFALVRLGPTRATAAGVLAAVAGTSALSIASGAASDLLGLRGGHGNLEVIAHALEHPTIAQCAAALGAIAVAPGVAEETFFRGLVQTRLLAKWGAPRAVLVTAAAFGVLHLDVVQGSLAFLLGLFLGFVAERAGGIRPSIAAHIFNNALFVVSSAWGSAESTRADEIAAVGVGLIVCAASAGVLLTPVGIRPLATSPGQ